MCVQYGQALIQEPLASLVAGYDLLFQIDTIWGKPPNS